MIEQGKEGVLNNILSVRDRYTKADCVLQEPCPHQIEKAEDFLFQEKIFDRALYCKGANKIDR
jgi:hypothetical protein